MKILNFKLKEKPDIIIDGILGYSIKGNPRGMASDMIEFANSQSFPILAVDIPSGIDPDKGLIYKPYIKASYTATLALPKKCFLDERVKQVIGKLYLIDISIPNKLYEKMGIKAKNIFEDAEILKI